MVTEKDIRTFIQKNKIRIPEDDGFMENITRQLDLLPLPARLSEEQDKSKKNAAYLCSLMQKQKRKTILTAGEYMITTIIINITIITAGYILGKVESDISFLNLIIQSRYLICGILCALHIALSVKQQYQE